MIFKYLAIALDGLESKLNDELERIDKNPLAGTTESSILGFLKESTNSGNRNDDCHEKQKCHELSPEDPHRQSIHVACIRDECFVWALPPVVFVHV